MMMRRWMDAWMDLTTANARDAVFNLVAAVRKKTKRLMRQLAGERRHLRYRLRFPRRRKERMQCRVETETESHFSFVPKPPNFGCLPPAASALC